MTPYIGELRVFAYQIIPEGWLPCEGQSLPVLENQALYQLLGQKYGGSADGTSFNLPDLRSRTMMATSSTAAGMSKAGHTGGFEQIALTEATIPAHTHPLLVEAGSGDTAAYGAIAAIPCDPGSGNTNTMTFTTQNNLLLPLHPNTIGMAGGGSAHQNLMPSLAMQVCIAITGIYPNTPPNQ